MPTANQLPNTVPGPTPIPMTTETTMSRQSKKNTATMTYQSDCSATLSLRNAVARQVSVL